MEVYKELKLRSEAALACKSDFNCMVSFDWNQSHKESLWIKHEALVTTG